MSAQDIYAASQGRAVTKSDTTVIPECRALWVGGAGDVAVVFADGGSAVTLSGVAAGSLLPIRVTKVMAATTATLIVALY